MVRRYGDLWKKVIDPANIALAYRKARRGKSKLRGVKNFEKDVEGNLERIRSSLVNKTFHTAPYTSHIIYEPKQRTIYALPFNPDRVVQHALINVLAPIWTSQFIHDTYACIEGRGIHAGSRRCMEFARQNTYCLKMDISKFYPSICHELLRMLVRRKIKGEDILWLLDDIINSFPGPTNVPIGNLTSQWFGNLFLAELDHYIKHILKIKHYLRYCDDFIIFSNDKTELHKYAQLIREFCWNRLHLKLSKADVFPTRHGIDFLGYRHFPSGYMLLRKSTAKRLRRKMDSKWFQHQPPEYQLAFYASMYGWAIHSNCFNFLNSVKLYERVNRLISRGGGLTHYERFTQSFRHRTRHNQLHPYRPSRYENYAGRFAVFSHWVVSDRRLIRF